VSERCHFVLLSDQGYSPPEIGGLVGYHPAEVRVWLKRFQAQGLTGLFDRPRSGRPVKATMTFVSEVAQTLVRNPNDLGYLATFWTVALVLTNLLKRGWRVSGATVRGAFQFKGE
jgi:transposase